MHKFHLTITPDSFDVERGAFDRWIGQTVPLRGPDRRIIGEATITDIDHREDGVVWVTVETNHDVAHESMARIAHLLADRSPMSFSVKPEDVVLPYQPKRDDDVARWLKNVRDSHSRFADDWYALDDVLDEYRARADYGLTLDADLSELPDGY